MPEKVPYISHDEILRYEEILQICEAAASLGITRFKVTGGEPFVRRGVISFIRDLKRMPGVEQVTLTTNGLSLPLHLEELQAIGIDGINVSLDALSEPVYEKITGSRGAGRVLSAAEESAHAGIRTKINAVLLKENAGEWLPLLALADRMAAVRFIERMPVGAGNTRSSAMPASLLLQKAHETYTDLRPVKAAIGNGPAVYYETDRLKGKLGIISANSSPFCAGCNRLRLTSTGQLQTCLGFPPAADLREAVRAGADRTQLADMIVRTASAKPAGHASFYAASRQMNEIGG